MTVTALIINELGEKKDTLKDTLKDTKKDTFYCIFFLSDLL